MNITNIYIGSDHAGRDLNSKLVNYLRTKYPDKIVKDYTDYDSKWIDYPDIASKLSLDLIQQPNTIGILICGSGIGMSIASNKIKGIRCALCHDVNTVKLSRQHNNSNILAMGERIVNEDLAKEMVDIFINESFLGEHHILRIDKIHKLE